MTDDPFLDLNVEDIPRLLQSYDPLTWAVETAKIVLPRQGRITFDQHPFLEGIYRDTHRNIVGCKGAQIGLSTWAVLRSLWALTTWPLSSIYTMPTDVGDFTATRVDPLIQLSDYLRDRVLEPNSVHVKRFALVSRAAFNPKLVATRPLRSKHMTAFGFSTSYYSGALNAKEAISRDADLLIHDEEDKSDPEVIEMYRSRISGPGQFKWLIRLSTPTFPGYGIDRAYRQSDMRRWLIRCPGCNERFEMAFPDNIVPQTYEEHIWNHPPVDEGESCPDCYYRCAKCGRRLSDAERGNGAWVAERPDHGLAHGYAVGQMAALYIPAVAILKARADATFPTQFWNLTMGVAHDEGSQTFTRETLIGSGAHGDYGRTDPNRPMVTAGQATYIGIDTGTYFDYVVDVIEGGVPRTIAFGRTPVLAEMIRTIERFNPVTVVIDALPEQTVAADIARHFNRPGNIRVWRHYFGSENMEPSMRWDEDTGKVTSPRNRGLSETAQELLTTRLLPAYNGSDPMWAVFIDHHLNSKRVAELQKGLERAGIIVGYRWINVGADHQYLASHYARIARLAPRGFVGPVRGALVSVSQFKRASTSDDHRPLPTTRR